LAHRGSAYGWRQYPVQRERLPKTRRFPRSGRGAQVFCALCAAGRLGDAPPLPRRRGPKGPRQKRQIQKQEEDATAASARARFEERRRQWAKMRRDGRLDMESSVTEQAVLEKRQQKKQKDANDRTKVELQRLRAEGKQQDLVELLPTLRGDPWQYGVECLLSLGALQSVAAIVRDDRSRIAPKNWAEAAVALADAVLCIHQASNEAIDKSKAEELLAELIDAGRPRQALEVYTQLAILDAQRAVNLLERARWPKSDAEREAVGQVRQEAGGAFEKALSRLSSAPKLSTDWHLKEANMSHFGSGNSIGAWNDEPKMVNRWNTLIRLVAKRRRMQDVFQVYDAMRALWVRADHGTTEFIARAAVATVDLSGLVDSFHTMPPARYPEVVFVGWSNVGKSSLINSLLHRTAVAPVSTMPGKTTQFHFYTINERNAAFPKMTLVDVPGIGEAMADEVQTRHWRRTLDLYLKERGPTLRQVFHLISCEVLLRRQKPSPLDISVMEMCLHHRSKFNLDYTLVITKIDLIRSKKDAETVYENLCKVVRRLRLGSAKIVPASVRSTTGRVLLWKRLWRSVDPENSVWHSSQDLSALRQEVERLVEAKDAEALIKRAKEESGDGWECIVRGILALGRLHDAWHIIQAGPQRAQGLEEQETAEDAMENDMEMLKEGLLEAAEAGEEAAEDEDEEDAQEVSEEEAGADFFAIPEDLESEQMAAMQERAALAVGEAALAPTSDAGNETLLAPRDPALAEEVAKMLSKEHRGAAAELLMEQVVASARLESLDSGFARSFGKLEALLKQAKEDAIFTPWSADRWNRLLRVVGSQGNLPAVERVLDYMSQFQVTGDQETDAVMAELVVSSVDLGGQALGPCELEEGNPGSAAAKVLLLGGRGFSSRKGGPDRAAIADAIVSTIPRRRIEDELAAVSRETALKTRGKKSSQQLDVPLASLLNINKAPGPSGQGSVPVTLLSVPALQRPSVPTVEKELANASGAVSRNAARGGVWGSTLEAEEEVKSEAAAWRDGVCKYLSGPSAALLGGVFHVVDARDFAQKLSAEVPSHCRPGEEVFIQRRLETLLASKRSWLPADDRVVQAAALRARPKRYVLVVADCAQLSLGGSRRFLHQFYVLPFVAQQRRDFLREKLLQEVSAAAEAIQGERPPQISVLLADPEQFYHSWEFWRHFWSCATSTE